MSTLPGFHRYTDPEGDTLDISPALADINGQETPVAALTINIRTVSRIAIHVPPADVEQVVAAMRAAVVPPAASGVQPDTRPASCACDGQTLLEVHTPGGCRDEEQREVRAYAADLEQKIIDMGGHQAAAGDLAAHNARLRAELEQARRYRTAWLSARERAVAHSEGTLRVVKDRETYQGWLKAAQAELEQARAILSHIWQVDALDRTTASGSDGRDAENERLRTENERMRHELEVMYGGAFDSPPGGQAEDGAQQK
ncbi:hypothetical protein [Streptomyces niveus]|uniref:hypothetical protein n=1 Tax=Streptomyces niveus TaxID=193462 RepID=UPI00386353FB